MQRRLKLKDYVRKNLRRRDNWPRLPKKPKFKDLRWKRLIVLLSRRLNRPIKK